MRTPDPCVGRYRTRLRPNYRLRRRTAQLIHPTDRTSVIMIVWPAVVSKFLILEAGVEYSYSVAAPHTRQERRS
jgi:hypothetical protein